MTWEVIHETALELRRSKSFKELCKELNIEHFDRSVIENGAPRPLTKLETMLSAIVGHSVRLHGPLSGLADQVLRREEKALVSSSIL